MAEEPKNPELTGPTLTPEQRERLQSLQSEILFDRIVVSFSIDSRDDYGRKKSTFYSASATRKPGGGEITAGPHGFTADEERVVHAILSKRVVATVYGDAAIRKVLPGDVAKAEAREILAAYDHYLTGLMNKAKP